MAPFIPDPKQQQAIEHVHGPMLVVAGAGTGKTTVLTQRVARLIAGKHARTDEILAITYTKKAAWELRDRLSKLGVETAGLQACNFHQYCHGLLRRNNAGFDLLTREDLWIYLRQRFEQLPLKRFVEARRPEIFLDPLLEFFDRCNDELVTASDYAAYVERLGRRELSLPRVGKSKDAGHLSPDEVIARCQETSAVFTWVEQALERDGLGTFGTMIVKAVDLLKSDPGLLAHERQHARFVLIDEFQDSNIAQIELAALLAGDEHNIFAVGDPDQAIYRFRGASNAAFDEFLRRFPKAKTVVLDLNRRSLPSILDCASALIAKNPPIVSDRKHADFARRPLASWRAQQGSAAGAKVSVVLARGGEGFSAADQEAAEVAETIREMQAASGCEWSCFAVLCRNHRHGEAVAPELAARRIPISVIGIDALDTPEVRDLLAVLRAVECRDSLAIFRVAALPQFKVDPARLAEELNACGNDIDMVAALARVPGGSGVLAALDEAHRHTRELPAVACVEYSMRQFAIDPAAEPAKAFRDFVSGWQKRKIAGAGRLADLLSYMEFFPEAGGSVPIGKDNEFEEDELWSPPPLPNAVRLMTVHAAKGLEFDHVFVLRVQSQSFPTNHREPLFEFPQELRRELTRVSGDPKEIHVEEERRLFYVSMTRARDSLTLCAKPRTSTDDKPAKFLRETMDAKSCAAQWTRRSARAYRAELRAAAAPVPAGVGAWILRPPRASLSGPLSATAIETYEACPLQYKLSQEWHLPGEVSGPVLFGNAVHRVLQAWFDAVRAGRPLSIPAALALFREEMEEAAFDRELQRELYVKQGEEQLHEFLGARMLEPKPPIISTETGFQVKIGDALVRGRIDRIDRIEGDRVSVIDYKTGREHIKKDADDSLQLSIYALAAKERWKYTPERLVIYNLGANNLVETARDADQLGEAVERVNAVAAAIAAGDFEATPDSRTCGQCPFASLCPYTEQRLYDIASAARTQ